MTDTSTTSLKQRLIAAEQTFLTVTDQSSLELFEQTWDRLCNDFEAALTANEVDDTLKGLAHSIFLRIALLSEDFIHLEAEAKTNDYIGEIDQLLSQLSLEDISNHPLPSRRSKAIPTPRKRAPLPFTSNRPPYLPTACKWLSLNLHNPYPSDTLKRSFTEADQVSLSTIREWFKSMRRHIGWTALCQRHFQGAPKFAKVAATRFFVSGAQSALPAAIVSDFIAMRAKLDSFVPTTVSQSVSDDEESEGSAPYSPSSRNSSNSSRPPSLVFSSSDSDDEVRARSGGSSPTQLCVNSTPWSQSDPGAFSQRPAIAPIAYPVNCEASGVPFSYSLDDDALVASFATRPPSSRSTSTSSASSQLPSSVFSSSSSDSESRILYTSSSQESAGVVQSPPARKSNKRSRSEKHLYIPNKRFKDSETSSTPQAHPTLPKPPTVSLHVPTVDFLYPLGQASSSPLPADAEISCILDVSLFNDNRGNATPSYGLRADEIWASDRRPLAEIIEDAPSSTTLKLLSLPDVDASSNPPSIENWDGDFTHPFETVTCVTPGGRELPPIQWSSSSLAGALGPPSQDNGTSSKPSLTLDEALTNVPQTDADSDAPLETQDLAPQTSNVSFDAILPSFEDPWGESMSLSTSSSLEDADVNDSANLQQLLDLLGSRPYTQFAF